MGSDFNNRASGTQMIDQDDLISNLHFRASEAIEKSVDLSQYRDELLLAYRIRCVEESFLNLFSKSKVSGTVHTCIGQELTGVCNLQISHLLRLDNI